MESLLFGRNHKVMLFVFSQRMRALVRVFWHDTDGIVLPYVTIVLIAIIGISLLALDGARLMSFQTNLQNRADAISVAAAAELDRTPTAIARALRAINAFGQLSSENIKVGDVRFLSSLPLRDSDPITPVNVTTDPTRAAFVEVTLQPASFSTVLPASLFGAASVLSATAQSVAGFDQIVCNSTPLYVCNPFEYPGMSYAQATAALVDATINSAKQPKLIRLSRVQGKRSYQAGDFGYLTPATGTLPIDSCGPPKGNGIGQALAASRPPICFRLSSVDPFSADDRMAMDGLNTRFDIYADGFERCKANFVADVNVRKGYIAPGNTNWCIATPYGQNWPLQDSIATPLPLDNNMVVQSPTAEQRIDPTITLGSGVWDCLNYWHLAHYAGPGANAPPPGCTTEAKISRYSVYQYEMQYITDRSLGGEDGDPKCNPLGIKYRRVVQAAIINCGSGPQLMNDDSRNVPAAGFGRFFITIPAGLGTTIYAEFLGLIKPGDVESHDTVQIYR